MVVLSFSEPAARRLGDFTAKNIGDRIAVIINGEVVSDLTIEAPDRELPIQNGFTDAQAQQLVRQFNGRNDR